MVLIERAGHFLHLGKPSEVGEHIVAWVSAARVSCAVIRAGTS